MRRLLGWACLVGWAALAMSLPGASPAKQKTAPKQTSSSKNKKTPAKKTSAKSGSRKSVSKKKKAAPRVTWRNRQSAPTPERYKEIQDALVSKGYLAAENATGSWGPPSVEALKRFQADQRLDVNGKINSLSLIALGLGPRRDPMPAIKPPEEPGKPPAR